MRNFARSAAVAFLAWSAAAPAQTFKRFDKVQAEVEVGQPWQDCFVNKAYPGAYDVTCDSSVKHIIYDTRVRKAGGQPIGQTAAQPVTDGEWKANDIVMASPTMIHQGWMRCVYNQVGSGGWHEVTCAGPTAYLTPPDWIRVDDEHP